MPSAGGDPVPVPAFHVMMKPRGAICNLDCKYCYFLAKEDLYPGSGLVRSSTGTGAGSFMRTIS